MHVDAGAASLGTGGDAGAGLALQRADADLTSTLERAPWITAQRRAALTSHLHNLERTASSGAATKPFAADVDGLATEIDTTFGLGPASRTAGRRTAAAGMRLPTQLVEHSAAISVLSYRAAFVLTGSVSLLAAVVWLRSPEPLASQPTQRAPAPIKAPTR